MIFVDKSISSNQDAICKIKIRNIDNLYIFKNNYWSKIPRTYIFNKNIFYSVQDVSVRYSASNDVMNTYSPTEGLIFLQSELPKLCNSENIYMVSAWRRTRPLQPCG